MVNEGNKHSYRPIAQRLDAKTEKTDTCWLWRGAIGTSGYGRIGGEMGDGTHQVHRVAYEIHVGPIPDGMHIDHLCGQRACVNPEHLEAVTQAENNRRANAKRWSATTHCRRGHAITPENSGRTRTGRYCLECARIGQRAARRGMTRDEYLAATDGDRK